jgi:hypothetical protein
MRKQILHAAVLATSALAFTGFAQAGISVDNNTDGVAQYTTFSKDKQMSKSEKAEDISPAAGSSRRAHEDNSRYNN